MGVVSFLPMAIILHELYFTLNKLINLKTKINFSFLSSSHPCSKLTLS
jgi:hypothetical protein